VQIRVVIASTNGTNSPLNLTQLAAVIDAVPDTVLATSIGAALSTTITLVSQNVSTSTVPITRRTRCDPGKWCTAGLIVHSAHTTH
jgi:hypothetical protein